MLMSWLERRKNIAGDDQAGKLLYTNKIKKDR